MNRRTFFKTLVGGVAAATLPAVAVPALAESPKTKWFTGTYAGPGLALVGDDGPELVSFPWITRAVQDIKLHRRDIPYGNNIFVYTGPQIPQDGYFKGLFIAAYSSNPLDEPLEYQGTWHREFEYILNDDDFYDTYWQKCRVEFNKYISITNMKLNNELQTL